MTGLLTVTRYGMTATQNALYVDQATGSDSNNGQAWSTPMATIQGAINLFKQQWDSNGQTPWIYVKPGTYGSIQDYGQHAGLQPPGGGTIVIAGCGSDGVHGSGGTSAVAITSASGVNAVSLDGYASLNLSYLTISAPGAAAVYATNGGIVEVGQVRFGTANEQLCADVGGMIAVTGNPEFAQGALYMAYANMGGTIEFVPGITLTFDSGVGYSQQLFYAGNGGRISVPISQMTVSGSPGGQKAFASLLGIVNAGGNVASLPGTVAAGTNYGGQIY